jgi:hypothetical protein
MNLVHSYLRNIVKELMCSAQFRSFLMAYPKAKLKSNGDKAYSFFSPFEEEMHRQFLPKRFRLNKF